MFGFLDCFGRKQNFGSPMLIALILPCLSCWLLFTLNKKILTLTLDVLTDLDTKGDVSEKQQESWCYFNYCVFIHIYIEIAHWEKHVL